MVFPACMRVLTQLIRYKPLLRTDLLIKNKSLCKNNQLVTIKLVYNLALYQENLEAAETQKGILLYFGFRQYKTPS